MVSLLQILFMSWSSSIIHMRLQTMRLFYRVISIHLVDIELKSRQTEVTHTHIHKDA
jgi:hypothetical protein